MSIPMRHDRFFKKIMQFPSIQRAFIERHLPTEIIQLANLNQLQAMPANFAQANKTLVPDCVLRAPYKEGHGFLYIIVEQETNPNKQIPIRLAIARGRVFEYDLLHENSQTPPIVWTLIFCTGKRRWKSSLDIFHQLPPTARKWAHDCINGPPQLVQALDMPLVQKSSSPQLDAMQLLMQKAYDDPVQAFIDLGPLLQAILRQKDGKAIFNEMFHYVLTGDGHESASQVIMRLEGSLQGNVRRTIMTIAQVLKKEWLQEGVAKGRQEGEYIGLRKGLEEAAIGMLRRGMQAKEVIEITHLSKQRITELLEQIQHAVAKSR